MSVIQLGLIDTTRALDPDLVAGTAAALNIQVMRDLPQFWPIQATVRHLTDPTRVPAGVWPVRLVSALPAGAGGVHLDRNNQPCAFVLATPAIGDWTVAASHETIEMLIDPWGNRLQTARAIRIAGRSITDAKGEFGYLVEGCDPCEANRYGYTIQGIAVSDFITPHYYDAMPTPGSRYSFAGHITRPRRILPGGYVAFVDFATAEWRRIDFLGTKPRLSVLGHFRGKSIRRWTDRRAAKLTHPHQLHVTGTPRTTAASSPRPSGCTTPPGSATSAAAHP